MTVNTLVHPLFLPGSVRRYFIAAGGFFVLLFAMLRPFGAANIGFLEGVAFWGIHVGLLIPLLIITHSFLSRSDRFERTAWWARILASGLVGAALFSPLALGLDALFGNEALPPQAAKLLEAVINEYAGSAPKIALCWLVMNAPLELKLSFNPMAASADDVASVKDEKPADGQGLDSVSNLDTPAFLDGEEVGDLYSLSAELHYLRIRTAKKESLVLHAIADAIRQLKGVDGIQIHRSHWVSRGGVESLLRLKDGDYFRLKNGTKLPISRRRLKEVKEWWQRPC
jgi:hypothetical protein